MSKIARDAAAKAAVKAGNITSPAESETNKADEKDPLATGVEASKVIMVKNTCKHIINTSKGSIAPGEEGEATMAEFRSYHKYLKGV